MDDRDQTIAHKSRFNRHEVELKCGGEGPHNMFPFDKGFMYLNVTPVLSLSVLRS